MLFSRNPTPVARYAFTFLIVALATLLRFALEPVLDLRAPFIIYFPTVVLCAWFGGLWPGLLATGLSAITAWYMFLPPQFSFTVTEPTAPAQLIIFSLAGVFNCLLAESLHRARRKTEASETSEREQRERYHVTLSSIGDAVIATDADGQVTFMNSIAETLTGWQTTEAAGRPLKEVFQIINEESRQPVENPALRAIKEGVIFGLANHTLLITKDGTERPIDDSGAPIKDAVGKTLGAVLIFRDISERRQVEKERALLANLVESSEDAIISKNLEGIIESWNAAAERLYEYTASEAIGQSITLIIPPERLEEEQSILARLRQGERIEHFETVRRAKSGRLVDISLTVSPVRDALGRIIGMSKIARDISARKQAENALRESEQRFRLMADAAPVLIWLSGTDKLCTWFNKSWLDFVGRAMEQELGNGWAENVHPDDFAPCLQTYTTAFDARQSFSMTYRLRRHDGVYRWVLDNGIPRFETDGTFTGYIGSCIDITDRQQAAEELRQQREWLRVTLASIGDAVIATDTDGKVTFLNPVAERLTGWPQAEATGQPLPTVFQIVNETSREPVENPALRAMREGIVVGLANHTVLIARDGTETPIDDSGAPIRNAAGEVFGSVLIFRDITERRLAEDRFRLAVEASPAGQLMIDGAGRIVLINTQTARLFGYTKEELLGQRVEMLVPERFRGNHPAYRDGFAQVPQARLMGAGRDLFGLRKDGREVPIEIGLNPIEMNGQTLILSSVVDITERKQAEEETRALSVALERRLAEMNTLMDILPVGVWMGNKDCSEITGNRAAYEIFGLPPGINASVTSPQPELPDGLRILVNGVEVTPEELPMQKVARTGQPWRNFEHAIIFPDGGTKTIYGSVAPLFDDQRAVRGVLAAYMDFTERKRSEEERAKLLVSERAAREQAEAASRAKDEFVAMISHEIRSPLNAILGWVQMLRTGQFDQATTARALETIERNAKTQTQLIEDLLDMSRIITGKIRLDVRPLELRQIVEAALDSIRPAAEAKAIQLQAHLAAHSSEVSGDPARLQQIAWNLLSNAVKFTPNRGHIELGLERTDTDLRLTVRDSGVGISPEFLPFVFDRFSQANTSSERKYGGLGLGLAIVRHLVELHGGTVHADSPGDGQGATFTVTLPIKARPAEITEFKPADVSGESLANLTETIRLDGLRILVVDDEAGSRDLLLTMLKLRGADVKACASAAETLATIAQWPPAILISDIGMPDVDGYALIRKLRTLPAAHGGEIPAVALTGYSRSADRTKALAAGFQMHVSKPVEAAELIAVIASLAGRLNKDGL